MLVAATLVWAVDMGDEDGAARSRTSSSIAPSPSFLPVYTHPGAIPRTLDAVPDTTTNGAHGERSAKVVKDDVRARSER
jgi:hypothetical protein